MTNEKIYSFLKSITKDYCLIKGWVEVVKEDEMFCFKNFTNESFASVFGLFSEDLIISAFEKGYFECNVDNEGFYEFTALLNYSPSQIGDYPPPNIECNEYMTVEFIEYNLICAKGEPCW